MRTPCTHGRCEVKPFTRRPDGRWLSYGENVCAWLPVLLDSIADWNALDSMLQAAARWCERKAAECHEAGAAFLRNGAPDRVWQIYPREAGVWIWRRDVLRECAEKLKAGPEGGAK